MFRKSLVFLTLLSAFQTALAADAAAWRGRSIYQVVTDRFARTDGSTTAACNTADRTFCGGTWRGIINKLDYIQGMGFDAVRYFAARPSHDFDLSLNRSGSRQLFSKYTAPLTVVRPTMVCQGTHFPRIYLTSRCLAFRLLAKGLLPA